MTSLGSPLRKFSGLFRLETTHGPSPEESSPLSSIGIVLSGIVLSGIVSSGIVSSGIVSSGIDKGAGETKEQTERTKPVDKMNQTTLL